MIVNVDITLEKAGMIADSSKMYLIGDVSPLARRLVKTTYEAMWKGIEVVKLARRWAILATLFSAGWRNMAIAWSENIVVTASVRKWLRNAEAALRRPEKAPRAGRHGVHH